MYYCRVCGVKLDYMPSDIEVRRCPLGHYKETAGHYYVEIEVNGRTFHCDSYFGWQNRKALDDAIDEATNKWFEEIVNQ
jgi:hypothetical protein